MKKITLILTFVFVLCGFLINAFAADKAITFAWEQDLPTDMGGWKLHYGLSSGSYTQVIDIPYSTCDMTKTPPACEATKNIAMVVGGEEAIYFFALTAYDTSNNESGFSNEVSKYLDFIAPPNPATFTATIQIE
jgi:hypothetical protein